MSFHVLFLGIFDLSYIDAKLPIGISIVTKDEKSDS